MGKLAEFIEKSTRQTVYYANTVTNDEAVFKLTPGGDTFTKFKGEDEFKSNDSNLADEPLMALQEITKKEYDDY